jgi:hypothetical protein
MSEISPAAMGENFDAAFEAKVAACTNAEQIKQLMNQRAISDGHFSLDWDGESRILTPSSTAPRTAGFAKAVVVNGVKTIIEGATEQELLVNETAFYRKTFGDATPERTEPARDASTGRFTSPVESVVSDEQKAALSLQFQLGQISASEYIEKSGAVSDYLEKAGVPIEDLRDAVAEKQTARVTQDWQTATQEFLNSSAGNWWPGGEANMAAMGKVLLEMGAELEPSAENLRRAAEFLRDSNQLVESPEVAARDRIASANSVSEILDATGYNDRVSGRASGMFNR